MNKQELIERLEGLKNIFGNECEYVKIDFVIELASELDEPQKVKIPQVVADVIEGAREGSAELEDAFEYVWEVATGELREWFRKLENRNIFARAWLDGYEVEKEKRYIVKVKGMEEGYDILNYRTSADKWFFSGETEPLGFRTKHTRKQLKVGGFGEVFNNPLFEVKEVEA
jgi:hypothetical protein